MPYLPKTPAAETKLCNFLVPGGAAGFACYPFALVRMGTDAVEGSIRRNGGLWVGEPALVAGGTLVLRANRLNAAYCGDVEAAIERRDI